MSSKQQKIDLLNKIKSGEMNIKDLIKNETLPLDAMFFSAHRREPDIQIEIDKFKMENPGHPYVVYRIVRDDEK